MYSFLQVSKSESSDQSASRPAAAASSTTLVRRPANFSHDNSATPSSTHQGMSLALGPSSKVATWPNSCASTLRRLDAFWLGPASILMDSPGSFQPESPLE